MIDIDDNSGQVTIVGPSVYGIDGSYLVNIYQKVIACIFVCDNFGHVFGSIEK